MICSQCGKEFTVLYPDMWRYRVKSKWFCTWKCLRADEKGDKEMPRMKKDGTPAKKPGARKTRVKTVAEIKGYGECETYKLKTSRGIENIAECGAGIGTNDVCEYRLSCPCHLLYMGRHEMKLPGDKEQATEELEAAVAALINDDVPMTAEERSEKYPMIPTRIDTKAGAWEMFEEYKGGNTLLGYTMKYDNGATPFRDSLRIVMTVEAWQTVCKQLDVVQCMMKL